MDSHSGGQLALPESAGFTHLTAAATYGWWLPTPINLPDDWPVFVAMPRSPSRPKRRGLNVAQLSYEPALVRVGGLRLTSPADTLLACARDLGLLDLVVLCDAALHMGSCGNRDILAAAGPGRRGAPLLRRAVALADGRSESAWESVLRMLHVVCDIGVEPQYVLRHAGAFVARGDLWLVGTRALHEYDGAVHRTPSQHRDDLVRDRRILDAGWSRRAYTSREVLAQPSAILREADAALGREHRPERIAAWQDLLAASMFSSLGLNKLQLRWSTSSSRGAA